MSCKNVPCGKCKPNCKPSYCYSRNNISKNWCKPFPLNKLQLHQKMPYIWRFLRPSTRKQMIRLSERPVKEINIPFTLYGSLPKKYRKKARTLKKKYPNI